MYNGVPFLFTGGMYSHAAHTMVPTQSPDSRAQATVNTTWERGLSYQETTQWHWVNKENSTSLFSNKRFTARTVMTGMLEDMYKNNVSLKEIRKTKTLEAQTITRPGVR